MKQTTSPTELAREALKLIASRGLPPTPGNFQSCYHEIAGTPNIAGFPEGPLRDISLALPSKSNDERGCLAEFDLAIGRRDWKALQDSLVAYSEAIRRNVPKASGPVEPAGNLQAIASALFVGIANLVERALPALHAGDAGDDRLARDAEEFIAALRSTTPELERIATKLERINHRVALAADEQVEMRHSLLGLLSLVVQNIGEITLDDHWLSGQVDALVRATQPPITLRRLDDAERRIRDVMGKQRESRGQAIAAREEMRRLLAEFVERLATIAESNSAYRARLEDCSKRLEAANGVEELAPLLKEVIGATQVMTEQTDGAHERLNALQVQVKASESELEKLHRELDEASAQARHDPLTDALNRKGLEEALAREIERMRRHHSRLSLAILDIDDFKKINDSRGHAAGDAALRYLADSARYNLRSGDILARYGGEEFVIVMPDTDREEGIEVMTRLQRELTKRIFLHDNERVLITFSAGVVELAEDETGAAGTDRADQAMYVAKRTGKNRVVGG